MENQNKFSVQPNDKVFATGVFLQAFEVEINGVKQWRWLAVGFEDDTYFEDKTIDLYDYANSFEGLIKNEE